MCYRWLRAPVLVEALALDLATEARKSSVFSAQLGEFLVKYDQASVSLGAGRCRTGKSPQDKARRSQGQVMVFGEGWALLDCACLAVPKIVMSGG